MKPIVPFDSIAAIYDDQFTHTRTGYLQRQLVYQHLGQLLARSSITRILELNCGTGADAIWLAKKGYHVLATDISTDMIKVAKAKASQLPDEVKKRLTFKTLAVQGIDQLTKEEPFDLVFSNFGGLNCISPEEMQKLSAQLLKILTPTGNLAFVIMSSFCWWESLYFLAKFNWKQAWRRRSKTAVEAPLAEGITAKTWYYSPREIERLLSPSLLQAKTTPVGFFLPPSYLDPAFKKTPKILDALGELENKISGRKWLAASADHFLIEFQKKLN